MDQDTSDYLAALKQHVEWVEAQLKTLEDQVGNLQTDVGRLTTDLQVQADIIRQISSLVQGQAQTISALQAEVAALQNPDLSGLEAELTTLEQNNKLMRSILPPAPAPTPGPTPAPTPPAGS